MAVITISRQYGSRGDEIAARVAELLGYAIFDKTMMARMAAEMGLTEQEIVDFSETNYRSQSFLDRLLGRTKTVGQTRTWTEDIQGVRRPEIVKVSDEKAIALVRGVITAAYQQGNVVIVGRGGQAILRDRPGVLHVRIEAPLPHRLEWVMEHRDLLPNQAELAIDDQDRAAQHYVKHYYDIDAADPLHYHLIINTGLLDRETAAEVIVMAVQRMRPVPQPTVALPEPLPFLYA
jgi:cytidylate kinase